MPFSMEEMIARSVRACSPAAEVAQINLESKVEDSLPKVRIDRRRLSKVFVNLIENAIQHSPQKSSVTIEAQRINDGNHEWVQCVIRDSGAGIPAEDPASPGEFNFQDVSPGGARYYRVVTE